MSKLTRKLHMIEEARKGIREAKALISSAGTSGIVRGLEELFPVEETDPRPMGVADAAFLAVLYEAWVEAGKPEINS